LPFYHNNFIAKNFQQFALGKNFWTTPHVFTFYRNRHENSGYNPLLPQTSVGIPSWMGFWATTCCCLGPFRWESLRGWDFRPQLVVVSGLFCGNPFVDGMLGHNLLLSQAYFFTMNSGCHEAFLIDFFLFSRWNSGYHEAFLTNFFLFFHDGILAITEPFSRTFFFFSRWNSGYHGAFLPNFFFFSWWNSGYHDLGEDSFHIYHKEYLHRIRLVKNLASWFRAPFARQKVRSFLF
jgi:hypothetical protein